jgi:FAD synthetase
MSKVKGQLLRAKRVMGFGTFDGLHPGHVSALKQLRELGNDVFVVVARDKNVKKIKGFTPHLDERKRLEAIWGTGLVDHALLGDEKHFYQCLIDHRPDVLGLGYDQRADLEHLAKHFPTIRIVRLKALKPHIFKTSILKKRLRIGDCS